MLRKLLLIALCVLLGYGIYNSVMQGGSSDSVTKATFKVSGINIVTTSEAE